jgi:uncharacterized protein YjbJ (UPF0337 family)
MADDGENLSGAGPVWERRGRRSGGSNPIVGLIVTLLALFGALTAGLSIAERSVGAAGDRIDGWISAGWGMVTGATAGDAVEAAGDAAEAAGNAAETAGDAAEAATDEVAEQAAGH